MQLSTLKHSCFLVNSTLKRSWVYAETLLRSIYTYIYLYKKTCSWEQQTVNKSFFVKDKSILIFLLITTTSLLTSCQKTIWVPATENNDLRVNQRLAIARHPAKYYVCGGIDYPCRSVTDKRQSAPGRFSNKNKLTTRYHSKSTLNKPKEKQNAVSRKAQHCKI